MVSKQFNFHFCNLPENVRFGSFAGLRCADLRGSNRPEADIQLWYNLYGQVNTAAAASLTAMIQQHTRCDAVNTFT